MFCPNCGAPNADDATTCQKCGFNIKGTASPKFKGTMLMMNANPGAVPGAPNPGLTPPMPTAADAQKPAIPRPGPAQPNSKLKGTMIGVAPPSLGATAPEPAAPPAGFGTPGQISPTQVSPVSPDAGAPPQAGGMGSVGVSPGHVQPAQFPGGGPSDFGQPAAGPAPDMAAAAAMAAAGAVGGVPETQPRPTDPRPTEPGASAPNMEAAQPGAGFGAPPATGAPAMVPMGGQPGPPAGAPGAMVATGGAGFTQRSPFMVFLFTMVTCGIYALFWYKGTGEEMEAKGAEIGPWWHLLVPILGLIWVYKWCQGLEHVSRGQVSTAKSMVLLIFLGPIGMAMLQSSINEL